MRRVIAWRAYSDRLNTSMKCLSQSIVCCATTLKRSSSAAGTDDSLARLVKEHLLPSNLDVPMLAADGGVHQPKRSSRYGSGSPSPALPKGFGLVGPESRPGRSRASSSGSSYSLERRLAEAISGAARGGNSPAAASAGLGPLPGVDQWMGASHAGAGAAAGGPRRPPPRVAFGSGAAGRTMPSAMGPGGLVFSPMAMRAGGASSPRGRGD